MSVAPSFSKTTKKETEGQSVCAEEMKAASLGT